MKEERSLADTHHPMLSSFLQLWRNEVQRSSIDSHSRGRGNEDEFNVLSEGVLVNGE